MIRAGDHEVVVTGGMESMSHAPYLLPKGRFGYRLGHGEVLDHMVFDGLQSTFDGLHMVEQASTVCRELGISREDQDAWAFRSQQRAAAAQDAGRFTTSSSPSGDDGRREHSPRHDVREARRSRPGLRPGRHDDRGQRTGVNDGASCVVVCSEEFAARRGLEPLATILGYGYVADDYAYLARTPANAAKPALARAGKTTGDLARVEINEAFASVAKNSTRLLGARRGDRQRQRRRRGARASDRRIGRSDRGTLVHELRRTGGGLGACGDLLRRRSGLTRC